MQDHQRQVLVAMDAGAAGYLGRDAAYGELVQLVSEGYSTQQIAQRLHISAKTVATHRENVLNELNISSHCAADSLCYPRGLEFARTVLHHNPEDDGQASS